jgi:hypothetical protein
MLLLSNKILTNYLGVRFIQLIEEATWLSPMDGDAIWCQNWGANISKNNQQSF